MQTRLQALRNNQCEGCEPNARELQGTPGNPRELQGTPRKSRELPATLGNPRELQELTEVERILRNTIIAQIIVSEKVESSWPKCITSEALARRLAAVLQQLYSSWQCFMAKKKDFSSSAKDADSSRKTNSLQHWNTTFAAALQCIAG